MHGKLKVSIYINVLYNFLKMTVRELIKVPTPRTKSAREDASDKNCQQHFGRWEAERRGLEKANKSKSLVKT